MKLFLHKLLLIWFLIILIHLHFTLSITITENLQLHSQMMMTMMKFKEKNKILFDRLYRRANTIHLSRFANLNRNQILIKHVSSIKKTLQRKITQGDKFQQYRYKNYQEIVKILYELEKKYPDYLKVETAQKLYGLPYPGGICDYDKKSPCEHHIAFLSNHKISNSQKSQIFISGEVHGNERVGPTATIELIQLMLENKDNNPWFAYLLDHRYIVIVPMTNPHGYYDKIREELLIKDEDIIPLNKKMYAKTHKDINRDFPYLVKETSCMETIGARVVNELYIHHLFSVALSLHGGTESLSFPYGTPNHLDHPSIKKIPITYKIVNNKLKPIQGKGIDAIIKEYRKGKYDFHRGSSTNPPDYFSVKSIAFSAAHHSTKNKKYKYPIGDMNGIIYPVVGGMEDWAYSGSWEGFPIITQPCKPTTYGGYAPEKTMYQKNYPDAMKSIMFLLEVSHEKAPEQKFLGVKNVDCIINLRENAFFNKISDKTKFCLDGYIDGYIPRIIRISLTLIDILSPYITFTTLRKKTNHLQVKWTVGGAITVNKTFIFYKYLNDELFPSRTLARLGSMRKLEEIEKILTETTPVKSGKGVWDIEYTSGSHFSHEFSTHRGKYLVFVIVASVDANWGMVNNPEPDVLPQTHIANGRTNANYRAENNGFSIEGQYFFKSEIGIFNTQTFRMIKKHN